MTKPITLAAVGQLIREENLSRDDQVFCVTEIPPDCLLPIEPPPGQPPDPRLEDITVLDLMLHWGGWDRELSGDPMFRSIEIADALNIPSPPDKYEIARYMVGQPLDFDPGERMAYSNFGYLVLGLVIEQVSGQTYLEYVRENIFAPLWITDIELGRTLPEERNPREPFYNCSGRGRTVRGTLPQR